MEIRFRFYKDINNLVEIKSHPFDTRGGLDNIIVGLDWTEVETDDRLLYQLEKALSIDLSFLDYWNEKVHNQYLDVDRYITQLKTFVKQLNLNGNYYQQIEYAYVSKDFLEKGMIEQVSALIEHFQKYHKQEAILVKIEVN